MHVKPGQVFRPIGVLNRFEELRQSKVKYKFVFYKVSFPPSPSSLLKLPNILTWLRGIQNKLANFLSFFCPSVPIRDLNTKKTPLNIDVCPESLGAMLEY